MLWSWTHGDSNPSPIAWELYELSQLFSFLRLWLLHLIQRGPVMKNKIYTNMMTPLPGRHTVGNSSLYAVIVTEPFDEWAVGQLLRKQRRQFGEHNFTPTHGMGHGSNFPSMPRFSYPSISIFPTFPHTEILMDGTREETALWSEKSWENENILESFLCLAHSRGLVFE